MRSWAGGIPGKGVWHGNHKSPRSIGREEEGDGGKDVSKEKFRTGVGRDFIYVFIDLLAESEAKCAAVATFPTSSRVGGD